MSTPSLDTPLLPHLLPHSLVLDIGCGTGRHAHELARAGFRVVALDMDFDAVSTAGELGESAELSGGKGNAHFLTGRAEALPFPDTLFDAVVCLDVLHWSGNASHFEMTWNEAWRVLRGGGLFHVRCLFRDALPSALPIGEDRHRLESGAAWFLPGRARLDALLAQSAGTWLLPPVADAQGVATMTIRKPELR